MAQINKSKSLDKFAYQHYLHAEGLKSNAVKQMEALARSLRNVYNQDKWQHFHAELMIALFKF